ncbi:MAG: ATP-binding protein [Planctomycetaceae bacterium]
MLPEIELFCVGFAAVVDTVLLLVVLERVNRALMAIWLKWSLVAVTFWHVGSFLHALLRETTGATADRVDALCMIVMAGGLVLLSCSILHAGLRVYRNGAIAHPETDRRYGIVYLPVLFLPFLAATILSSGGRDFVMITQSYHVPFLSWLSFANLTAAWLFLNSRGRFEHQPQSALRFLLRFSIGLVGVTLLVLIYVLAVRHTSYEPVFRLLTNLSPLLPTLVFAYYIFRRRLLPLVFERTLVYGGILLAVFYLHRLTLYPLMNRYSREFQFDFVVIEGLLLVSLILAYQPLRNRCREALLYLIGGDVTQARDAARQLSVELSRRADDDIQHISEWFADGLQKTLRLRYTWLTLSSPPPTRHVLRLADTESPANFRLILNTDNIAEHLHRLSVSKDDCWIDRSRCRNTDQLAVLRELDLIAVFRMHYRTIDGFLLLGAPLTGDRLSDEQLNTLTLLVDQFAATIHNRHLEDAKQSAERRAVQQEKLSTLGLLAGSLAHELKNPLSSMKTIATLLREDLGAQSEHSHDVELIVSEIDRLTQTTRRLLDFSRPPDADSVGVAPDRVIERLMHILSHLAKQHGVKVTLDLQLQNTQVYATDASLSEILFNLIRNAIEAAAVQDTAAVPQSIDGRRAPEVCISTRPAEKAMIVVSDNGPGISAELQNRIFEPFVTGKTDGTGLGLYLVAERVRELHGTIHWTSTAAGTAFEVMLPTEPAAHENSDR